MAENKAWVPGCDEVLAKFEEFRRALREIHKQKKRVTAYIWKEVSYVRRDKENIYCRSPAIQRFIKDKEEEEQILIEMIDNKNKDLGDDIVKMLKMLDKTEQNVLINFYWLGRSWTQTAADTSYSDKQCRRIRDNAIATIAQKIFKTTPGS